MIAVFARYPQNEPPAKHRTPMDLTAVEPFRLGIFEVAPARGEVRCGDTVARLEPKVMAVLVALARTPGETVSREKLFDEVWEGRAVTDDALTRCISALRRVFGQGQGVEIKSLPKLGYLLVAETVSTAPAKELSVSPSISPVAVMIAGAVALLIGTAAVVSFRAPPDTEMAGRVRPLTSLQGLEFYPALAPAGGQLAFAHRTATGQWDLFVKSVAGGEPQRLTNDSAREQHPVWSRTGDELAYVRRDGETCDVMRMAIPGGAARKIAECGAKLVHSLDWSPDGRFLVLTRADERLEPARLALIALEGVAPQFSIDRTQGAEDARFNPDGTTIALTLSTAIGAEDVYTIDMASGALTRVTTDNAKVHGLDWTSDGRAVVYGSNRGGSFGLHRVSIGGGAPVSLLPSLQDVENPSVSGARIAYEVWTETGGLKTLGQGQVALPPDSTRLEWHPDVARDGAIAFVSDRGGAPEVWLSEGAGAKQLTHFGDAYIHTPKFAPDGKTIAFSAPQRGHFNLYLVDRDGVQKRLTDHAANDMSPAWSPDGRAIYFASDRDGAWRVWRLDVESGRATRVAEAPARAVFVLNAQELVTVDPVKGGLYRIDLARADAPPKLLTPGTAPSDWANVAVAGGKVIYIRREPPDRAVLRRLDPETGSDEALADLDDFYFRSGLAVTTAGMIVYATTSVEDVSLMLYESKPVTAF